MKTFRALVIALLTLFVAAPAASAQSTGLVAAYGFEEASGAAAVDSSGAGNAGALAGATRSASGRFGAALSFDGVDDRVDVADSASLDLATGMTLEAWVRPQSTGWRTVVMKERAGGLAYLLYASTDTNRPSTEVQLGSATEARGPSSLAANVWTHLASTYDGATLRLYVNGTQVASRAATGAITTTSSPLRIGGNTVWGEYFRGLIDEVRVYNRALTAGEIQNDMGTAILPADAEPPTAPTGLSATASGNDIHLAWGAASDNVGVTGYRVYRDGTLLTTLPGTATSFDDVDRPYGSWRYHVVAIDGAGLASPASNEEIVTLVDPDAQVPTAVTLTATVSGGNDVHLAWSESIDDLGVKEYRVYLGTVLYRTLPGTTRSFDDLDVAAGTRRYVVRAIDNAGHMSPMSNEEAVTVEADTTPPTAPVLSATAEDDGVHLSWTASTDEGEGVASYDVYRLGAIFGDRSTRLAGFGPQDTRTYVDRTTLPSETTYRYRVLVRDRAGNFVNSNTVDVRIGEEDLEPPTAPVLTVTNGDPSWTAATDDHAIMEYALYVDGRVVQFYSPQTLGDPFLSLTPGTHTLKITATDTAFKRSESNEVVVTLDPSPVLSFTKPDGNDVKLTWTAPNVASSYRVYRDGSLIHTRGGTSPREFSETNLAPGTYRYKVEATDTTNRVWESNVVEVVVTEDTSPPTASLAMACDGATVHDYVDVRGTMSDDRGPITWHAEVDGRTIVQPSTTLTTGGPFRFEWETRDFSNGPHDMTLVLRDGAGNETVTEPCRWTVHNPVVTVPFAGLSDGDTVSGTVKVTAVPKGDGEPLPAGWPVVGVAFGGALAGFDTTGPYETDWDTTKVADGVYTLTAAVQWMDYNLPRATNSIQVRVENTPDAPAGLVAAYGFEHSTGTTAADSSGTGSTGTISGASSVAGGRFGRALSFDGIDDMVTVLDASPLDLALGMTLSAWVRPTTVSDWRTVLLKERPGSLAYALYAATDNGRPQTEISTGGMREARGTAALPVNTWTHLASTYDGATLRLYVNGTQVASAAASGTLTNSAGALRIGGNAVWGEWFSGLIDEVRVYERALTAAEIQADSTRSIVPGA